MKTVWMGGEWAFRDAQRAWSYLVFDYYDKEFYSVAQSQIPPYRTSSFKHKITGLREQTGVEY